MIDLTSVMSQIGDLVKYGSLANKDNAIAQNEEQSRMVQEGKDGELKQAAALSDLEFKQKKNQITLLQELVKLFDSGKRKKNPDGTEEYEPNPILEALKNSVTQLLGGTGYDVPESSSSLPQNSIPQEYQPEPEINPYEAPVQKNSVVTNTNDIVGKISNGGQDYLESGDLNDYLKRYLH